MKVMVYNSNVNKYSIRVQVHSLLKYTPIHTYVGYGRYINGFNDEGKNVGYLNELS